MVNESRNPAANQTDPHIAGRTLRPVATTTPRSAAPEGMRSPSEDPNGKLRLVVGYDNSSDLEQLRRDLIGTALDLVGYEQVAQRVFDTAIRLDADVVLLSPNCFGYRKELIIDLRMQRGRPIPVIGWVETRTDEGRLMVATGAVNYISLPTDAHQVARLVQFAQLAVDRLRRERDDGLVSLSAGAMIPRGAAWQSKVISVFVPKGGGSHRSTTAVNLATVLSHVTMGNQKTLLLDFDMVKGDCHTMLGYIHESEQRIALQRNMAVLERGLKDLFEESLRRYDPRSEGWLNLPTIKQYFVDSPALRETQLDLLPGLMRPTDSGEPVFQSDRQAVFGVARAIIEIVRRAYAFTVIDIGQDFLAPLHEAAIRQSDDVLVVCPPTLTAALDTRYALQALAAHFGDLSKFRLLISGFKAEYGMSERELTDLVGIPLAGVIPFDDTVATQAINTCAPYALTDAGPLGSAIRHLGALYLPQLGPAFKARTRQATSRSLLKSLFVRES